MGGDLRQAPAGKPPLSTEAVSFSGEAKKAFSVNLLAADGTYYTGGRTTLFGTATTRIGADFQTLAVAWQYLWL